MTRGVEKGVENMGVKGVEQYKREREREREGKREKDVQKRRETGRETELSREMVGDIERDSTLSAVLSFSLCLDMSLTLSRFCPNRPRQHALYLGCHFVAQRGLSTFTKYMKSTRTRHFVKFVPVSMGCIQRERERDEERDI